MIRMLKNNLFLQVDTNGVHSGLHNWGYCGPGCFKEGRCYILFLEKKLSKSDINFQTSLPNPQVLLEHCYTSIGTCGLGSEV